MFIRIFTTGILLFSASTIFSEEVRWPAPPGGYASTSPGIPKGTLTGVLEYPSKYGDRNCRIYTPPGFSQTRTEKYPVLYLHHGIGGNENAWTSNAGHQEGYADRVMDYLYAHEEYETVPMIVVMPMGNMTGTDNDTWQNFEEVLINDLAPYIEENYNASSDLNMRAIAGLSMGGGQTLNFGYKNPDVFTWIGAFSPAPNTIAPAENIRDIEAVKTNVHLYYFAAGTKSDDAQCLSTARNYHDYLGQQGVDENIYLQVEEGLGHERENWNRQLHHFAQRLFKGITKVAQPEIAVMKMTTKAPVTIQKAVLVGNSFTPWSSGILVIHSGTGVSQERSFKLDGRALPMFRSVNPVRTVIAEKE